MWDDDDERKGEGETRCRLIACSSRKAPRGAARLNVRIRPTNRYQQYYMPSENTYCGRIWNLIQDCDVQSSDQKVYISSPPSPEVENFQMKIYYPAGGRTPDLLNQRQICYHLSQRGEHFSKQRLSDSIVLNHLSSRFIIARRYKSLLFVAKNSVRTLPQLQCFRNFFHGRNVL